MSVINTNITSMIGQQNLRESQNALQTSMERLSSGLRINSAKDDAAGQSIANRMSAQITGLGQAQRNANDGISASQTAEGGLNQINDNLQRIRELSVQSQNGTNSNNDLQAIQDEISQRLDEIDRVSSQTDFNGTKVLEQEGALKIQVGANDNETISINLRKMDSQSLGLNNFTVAGDKKADLQTLVSDFGASGTADFTVDVKDNAGATTSTTAEVDLTSGKVTDGTNQLYVSATTGNITDQASNVDASTTTDSTQAAAFTSNTTFQSASQGDSATIGGVTFTVDSATTDANGNGDYVANIDGEEIKVTIANASATAGTDADFNVTQGNLYMDSSTLVATSIFGAGTNFTTEATNEDARQIDLESAGAVSAGASLTIDGNAYSVDTGGTVSADGAYDLDGDTVNDTAANDVMFIKDAGQASASLISQDDAVESTKDPMEKLDAALRVVDEQRSELGAVQNRFESAITNLSTTETNLSDARSRIEDADYATEVAEMTKNQILQQAGTSVLAQANQLPQSVLSLLG